jgi:hypothetical protein
MLVENESHSAGEEKIGCGALFTLQVGMALATIIVM